VLIIYNLGVTWKVKPSKEEPALDAISGHKPKPLRAVIALVILAVLLAVVTAGCGGGGEEAVVPPPQAIDEQQQGGTNRPIILSLSPSVATVGQTITITGYYFGQKQGTDCFVTIGGRRFTVVSWSDQIIEATVPTGATSGIVVVTVGTLASRSGLNAQLYIGDRPPGGEPMIIALSQDTAVVNTRVTIYGFNFGAEQGESLVTFTGPQGERVVAPVVSDVVDGVERPMWSDRSIQVYVPLGSYQGPVIVTVNGVNSNSNFNFTTMMPPTVDAPVIDSVSPERGPVGTTVTISGRNFGYSRGISVITIGGINMQVITWTNTQILAVVPQGATTSLVRVVVGGVAAESPHAFIVEAIPTLTAVIPNVLQVGQKMEVYGEDFGLEKGQVILAPETAAAGQAQTAISGNNITSWSDTRIVVNSLPKLNSDAGVPLLVTVRTGATPAQTSENSIRVNVFSPVQATLEVSLTAGVEMLTTFDFTVGVGGGVAPYSVEYNFGNGYAETKNGVVSTDVKQYIYPSAGTFTPYIRVEDSTGSRITVTGEELLVVATGQPVVYDIHIDGELGLNNNEANEQVAPNFGTWYGSVFNFDDTFVPLLTEIGLDYLKYARRQEPLFVTEGRPYGYRVDEGSLMLIQGYNLLGTSAGGAQALKLNIDAEVPYQMSYSPLHAQIIMWTDESIQFRIPTRSQTIAALGGYFGITYGADPDNPVRSKIPLVAQPLLHDYMPKPPTFTSVVTIMMNDAVPPVAGNYIGTKAYVFWTFPAYLHGTATQWLFNRDGEPGNDDYLSPMAWPVTLLPGQQRFTFDLSTIVAGITTNGAYPARDPAGGPSDVVEVDPAPGDWHVFLWAGVKESVFPEAFANSGIISNALRIVNVQP